MDAELTAPSDAYVDAETNRRNGDMRRGAPRLIDDYELRERLRRHPCADAFKAVHRPSGTLRVLYVLRPAAMQDDALVRRAACEAATVRWVRHSAVPTVDPCGMTPDQRLYIAVADRPYPGESLGAVVEREGALDVECFVQVATRVVEALSEAHAAGLVHGHLTPESILLWPPDARGRRDVVLLGLGTRAATAGPIEPEHAAYASPEQLEGATLDARSDVHGLASVLQLALAGDPSAVTDGSAYGSSTADVIARARAADPGARHASVVVFWNELLDALVRDATVTSRGAWLAAVGRPASGASVPADVEVSALEISALEISTVEASAIEIEPMEMLFESTVPTAEDPAPTVESRVVRILPEDAVPPSWADDRPVWQRRLTEAFGTLGSGVWRSVSRHRAATGLTAAGLLGAAGIASALSRPASPATADAPHSVRVPRVAIAPTTPIGLPSPRPRAATVAASVEKHDPPVVASVRSGSETGVDAKHDSTASDGAEETPGSSVPDVPRIADVAIPAVALPSGAAPAMLVRRDIVRADEFASHALRVGNDTSAARAGAAHGGRPLGVAEATREAERAMRAYAGALNARDLDALRRAAPEMPAGERARWAQVFRDAMRVRAEVSLVDVQVDGDVIAARVRKRVDVYRPGVAKPEQVDARSMAVLVRDATGWRLSSAP